MVGFLQIDDADVGDTILLLRSDRSFQSLRIVTAAAGGVTSFNGRVGAIAPLLGDYSSNLIGNLSVVNGGAGALTAALNTLAALGISGKLAPLLTDANSTLSLAAGSVFILPPATLTAPRVFTIDRLGLPTTTPSNGSSIYFVCQDATAFSKTIVNGALGNTIWTIPGGVAIAAYSNLDDGTNWTPAPSLLI